MFVECSKKTSRTSVKCKTRFSRFYSINGPPHVGESAFRNPGKSGIQGFQIRNSAKGFRNPTNDWNPESINPSFSDNESRIQLLEKKNLVVIRQWKQTVYLQREQLVHLQVILVRLAADQWLLSESSQADLKCLLKRLKNKNNTND